MLMVIVGAGASYGCRPDAGWYDCARPPLTAGLFSEREPYGRILTAHGAARGLVGRLRRRLDASNPEPLEELLAELSAEDRLSDDRKRELMAIRLYLQQVMLHVTASVRNAAGGVTFYDELVSLLSDWSHRSGQDVVYVSFNYDMLLDQSIAEQHGMSLNKIPHYTEGATKLFKPHGSANWVERVEIDGFHGGPIMPLVPAMEPTGEFVVHNEPARLRISSNASVFVPTLALPVVGKTTVSAPPAHMEALDQCRGQVSAVLTIGWRGREPHLFDTLRATLAPDARVKVCDVSQEAAHGTSEELRHGLALSSLPTWDLEGFGSLVEPSRDPRRTELDIWLDSA